MRDSRVVSYINASLGQDGAKNRETQPCRGWGTPRKRSPKCHRGFPVCLPFDDSKPAARQRGPAPPNSRTSWVPSSLGGFRCQGEWRENDPSQGRLRRGTPGQLVTLRLETSALEATGFLQCLKVRGSAISEDSHVLPLWMKGTDSSEYNASQPARASPADPRILHASMRRLDRTSGASFGDLPGAGQRIARRKGHGQWSGSRALEWRDRPPATPRGIRLARVGLPGSTHGVTGVRARRGSCPQVLRPG